VPQDRDKPAMIFEASDGTVSRMSFAEVDTAATGLAAQLRALGYGKGDPIRLHTDTEIGAIAVTLSQLYGPDTFAHALNDCRAGVILNSRAAWEP